MMKNERIYKLVLTALMAALYYVVFTFLQIKIALPGGDATSLHLGNAVCVLGALLLGGVYGGIGGAIGMTIGDLLDPIYIVYAPKTFILKFCIGLITGLVAHKIGKPAAEVTLSINIAATSINAVLSVIVATAVYMALRPVLAKSNMLPRLGKESACA